MIQQRYGNNIPLRIAFFPASVPNASALDIAERKVEVSILRRMGRTVPFAFTIEGNTILGTIFGKDQPHREDSLSVRITLDRGTEQQRVIDIPNIIALVSQSTKATILPTQTLFVQTNGFQSNVSVIDTPSPARTTAATMRHTNIPSPFTQSTSTVKSPFTVKAEKDTSSSIPTVTLTL